MGIPNAAGRQGHRPRHTDSFHRVRAGRRARPFRASRCIMALPQSHAADVRAEPGDGNRGCNYWQFYPQQLADLPRPPPDRMDVRARALFIRIDLQLRCSRERRHRHLAVHGAACVLVGRWHRRSGYELGVELCRYVGADLACMNAAVRHGTDTYDRPRLFEHYVSDASSSKLPPEHLHCKMTATKFSTRRSSMRKNSRSLRVTTV